MPVHAFFCENLSADDVLLNAEESFHASKVMRLGIGDTLMLLDGCGHIADASIVNVSKRGDQVACKVEKIESRPPASCPIRMYVAPPRGKNMDTVLRCATELGVTRITPILCRYGVAKPDNDKNGWHQTMLMACKQSKNPWLPKLDAPVSFDDALKNARELLCIGAVPRLNAKVSGPLPVDENGVSLWIGPEGGFDEHEEEALFSKGALAMTVGPCILRVETAVPALLGALYQALTIKPMQ